MPRPVEKPRVLLFATPSRYERRPVPTPYGLVSLGSALKGIAEVKIIDTQSIAPEEFEKAIEDFRPHHIGASIFPTIITYDQEGQIEFLRRLRSKTPNASLVLGGPILHKNLPETVFEQYPADIFLMGEAEHTLRQLIAQAGTMHVSKISAEFLKDIAGSVFRRNGKTIRSEKNAPVLTERDLECLEIDWNLLDPRQGQAAISFLRGCNGKCVFCVRPHEKQRTISADKIIGELKRLKAAGPNITRILIVDDNFIENRELAIEIAKKIAETGLHEQFGFEFLACVRSLLLENGQVDHCLLDRLKKMNVRAINIGIESLNDLEIKRLGKGDYTAEKAISAINAIKGAGMRSNNYLILSNPKTGVHELLDTVSKAHELMVCSDSQISFMFYLFACPEYGSLLYRQMSGINGFAQKYSDVELEQIYLDQLVAKSISSCNRELLGRANCRQYLFATDAVLQKIVALIGNEAKKERDALIAINAREDKPAPLEEGGRIKELDEIILRCNLEAEKMNRALAHRADLKNSRII